jgi:S1-C subfamily serine protease
MRMLRRKTHARAQFALFLTAAIAAFIPVSSGVAQQTGRIFPYKWLGQFPADDITTADIQHALIWSGHYGAMVDGSYGPYTKRAVKGWLSAKGYVPSETLTREQSVELVADGLKQRDRYGWALLTDSAVGFSVGIPTKLTSPEMPITRDGALWYSAQGVFGHFVTVIPQDDACAAMDKYYEALLNLTAPNRQVQYEARKDDWFVISGESGERLFYTRGQCRQQGIVTVVVNVPTPQSEALAFLFVAMTNSLSLRPVLNPRAKPAPRIDFPGLAPGATASASPFVSPPSPVSVLSVDRSGKTSVIKLTLNNGTEFHPQEVFERASEAIYIVKVNDGQGSAVAVSEHELLTNCHVVRSATAITLEREGHILPTFVSAANFDADRCVLRTQQAMPKWVKVRPYADVKVGERAFTIGAPRGLELTLAEGLISSKRISDGERLLQTSAPISPGSSGGGLFDAQGNLIGITTFLLKDAQNLNFAIAAEEYAR